MIPQFSDSVEVPVKRMSAVLRAALVEHFELFLTAAGVLVAIIVTFTELPRSDQGMAFTFLLWLQGFILWAVHRHCWFRRRALVQKMRVMLLDRVNNQLTIMLNAAECRSREGLEDGDLDMEVAMEAARTVSMELENLSLESLRRWERRYGRHLPAPLR